jgi:hypothetical protein
MNFDQAFLVTDLLQSNHIGGWYGDSNDEMVSEIFSNNVFCLKYSVPLCFLLLSITVSGPSRVSTSTPCENFPFFHRTFKKQIKQ